MIDWPTVATRCIEGLIGFTALGLWHLGRRIWRDVNSAFIKIRELQRRVDKLEFDEDHDERDRSRD